MPQVIGKDDDGYIFDGGAKVPHSSLNDETKAQLERQLTTKDKQEKSYAEEAMDVVRGAQNPMPGSMIVPAAKMGAHVASDVGGALAPAAASAADSIGGAAQQAYGLPSNPLQSPPVEPGPSASPAAGAQAPLGAGDVPARPQMPAAPVPTMMTVGQQISSTRGPGLDKKQIERMNADDAAAARAQEHAKETELKVFAEQQGIREAQEKSQALQQAHEQNQLADQDEALRTAMAKGDELASNVGKVDPKKYRKDQGIGGNILSALAMGLGSLGASLTHGPNTAMDIYNKRVDEDIDAQKTQIQSAKDASQLQNNRIAQIMSQGHDLRSAIQLARASAYSDLQRSLDSAVTNHGSENIQNRYEQMSALTKAQRDQAMLGYEQQAKGTIAVHSTRGLGVGGVPIGKGGKGIPPAVASQVANVDTALSALDGLEKTKLHGKDKPLPSIAGKVAGMFPGTDTANYHAQEDAALPAIGQGLKPGFRSSDAEMIKAMLAGDKTAGSAKQSFNNLRTQLMNRKKNLLKAGAVSGPGRAPVEAEDQEGAE